MAAQLGCHAQTARADLAAEGVEIRGTNKPQTEPKTCSRAGCENTFRPTPRQLRAGYGKFCSRHCDHEAHRKHAKPAERLCAREGCEERFTPTGSNVAYGWGKFCSKRCSAISTDAHTKRQGQMVACDQCGKQKWRYDCQIDGERNFCSRECWGAYRWKHGIAISDDVVSLSSGRSRQKWKGRWNGHKGAAAGIEGGRRGGRTPLATTHEASECWRLHDEGLSSRKIAAEVFGDARLYRRVIRLVAVP